MPAPRLVEAGAPCRLSHAAGRRAAGRPAARPALACLRHFGKLLRRLATDGCSSVELALKALRSSTDPRFTGTIVPAHQPLPPSLGSEIRRAHALATVTNALTVSRLMLAKN